MSVELIHHLDEFLDGRSSAMELEAWLVARLQAILDSGDEGAIAVANKLDADLIDLANGVIDATRLWLRVDDYRRHLGTVHTANVEARVAVSNSASGLYEVNVKKTLVPTVTVRAKALA